MLVCIMQYKKQKRVGHSESFVWSYIMQKERKGKTILRGRLRKRI